MIQAPWEKTRNCIGQDETVDAELRWSFTVWGLNHSCAQASNPQIAFGMVELRPVLWKNGNAAELIRLCVFVFVTRASQEIPSAVANMKEATDWRLQAPTRAATTSTDASGTFFSLP